MPQLFAELRRHLAILSKLLSLWFSSICLILAISYICFNESVATIVFPSPAPFSTPAACFNSQDVGGDFRMYVNDLSGLTVTTAGMGMPGV